MQNNCEDEKKVSLKDFNKYFRGKYYYVMSELEKQRKNAYLSTFLNFLFTIGCALIVFYFLPKNDFDSILFPTLWSLYLVAIVFALFYSTTPLTSYKNALKKTIFPKLLAYIGDINLSDAENVPIENYVKKTSLFDRYDEFSCDDYISGKYKNININIAEILLQEEYYVYSSRGLRRRLRTVFDGIYIWFPIELNYKGTITVVPKRFNFFRSNDVQPLANANFARMFDLYCTNKEAFAKIITPEFMDGMVEYAVRKKGYEFMYSYENGMVNIAIRNSRNWFEFPLFKPANDITIYRKTLMEIMIVIKLIDFMLDIHKSNATGG